jgi:hypothetical protein
MEKDFQIYSSSQGTIVQERMMHSMYNYHEANGQMSFTRNDK